MLGEERRDLILQILHEQGFVNVSDLSRKLCSTEATIRRDLDQLQDSNKLRRIHGGAKLIVPSSHTETEAELKHKCINEKMLIAKKAYEFVKEGDSIILGGSTTVTELARLVANGNISLLTIVTNSFEIASILSKNHDIKTIFIGGDVNYSLNSTAGSIAEENIRSLHVDKCFLGTNGIEHSFGYSSPTSLDASLKSCMIEVSSESYVLADHTKFEKAYLHRFSRFNGDISFLITDSLPQKCDRKVYEDNVRIVIASK